MCRRLLLTMAAMLVLAGPVRGIGQPAEAMLLAWQDIQTVAPDDQPYIRYLALDDLTAAKRKRTWRAAAGLLNALSLSRRIVSPALIGTEGKPVNWRQIVKDEEWGAIALMRVDLRHYRQTAEQWDKLSDPRLEPVFHVFTLLAYPAGKNADGSAYRAGEEKIRAAAPWLIEPLKAKKEDLPKYLEAAVGLIKATGYAQAPIIVGRNYVWQSSIDFDRPASYSSWLGFADRKSFDKLVRFDKDILPFREAVSHSGVAQQPRAIDRGGRGDGYWITFDQVNQRGIGNRNPLEQIDRNKFEFDAVEIIARLDNGMWATGLFNKDGVLQQSAPDGIGYAQGSVTNDGRIHNFLTCWACHDKAAGNGGLHAFQPYFRNLFADPGPAAFGFFSKGRDKKTAERLQEEYLSSLDAWSDGDKRTYAAALEQANGCTPQEFAVALVATFLSWDQPLDLEDAAAEHWVTSEELATALKVQMVAQGYLSNTSTNWTLPDARRMKIGRDQFTADFVNVQLALHGIRQWSPELKKTILSLREKPK